ncbi:MAG TPA: phosphoglucosamine mutase, partial [Actinobacteria bacterium]|nr:phosphoglucosamine mutase [Actinomycetota bacterium]
MRLFGTDGIRGITGQDLTADLATKLGNVAGSLLCEESDKVVIGRDTRGSGEMLENALTEGFVRQGIEVIKLGVIPTPAIAYITGKLGAVLGIVISASHNPSEYNGIKFFNSNGVK